MPWYVILLIAAACLLTTYAVLWFRSSKPGSTCLLKAVGYGVVLFWATMLVAESVIPLLNRG